MTQRRIIQSRPAFLRGEKTLGFHVGYHKKSVTLFP